MIRICPIKYGTKFQGVVADPYASYVINLLHFDGANNSKIYTDETGRIWGGSSEAEIVTDEKKFGTGSLYCNGSIYNPTSIECNDSYYTTPSIGTQDFCAEIFAWIDPSWTSIANRAIFAFESVQYKFTVTHLYDSGGTNGVFAGVIGSGAKEIKGTTTQPNKGEWYHLALTRDGNTLRFFVNGTSQGTSDVTGVNVSAEDRLRIGDFYDDAYYPFLGRLDEFRLTVGVPRYTSDFDPPTEPFVYP